VTTDEIRLLIDRLNGAGLRMATASECVTALTTLLAQLEIATQELKNIANADTVAWDDPTEYEAWAKSRARWALGKVAKIEKEKP
jgi:uncharacterized membrane protein YccC